MSTILTVPSELLGRLQAGSITGTAVALNLREVPHSENPLFRRALLQLVDRFAETFQPEIVDIGPYSQLLLFHRTSASAFIEKLQAIGSDFAAQHLASPRYVIFRLPLDTGRLEQFLQHESVFPRKAAAPTLSTTEAQWLASVHKLSTYEQILGGADVAAIVRESPVWQLRNGSWQPLFGEVTVAIDTLERAVGVPLRHDPWLLDQISPILDRRIIRHFETEPTRLLSPHSMNLRCATVIDRRFADFMRNLSFDQRANLIVELSARDPDLSERLFSEAVDMLRLWECRVALDHLSIRQANTGSLPLDGLSFLKIDLRGVFNAADEWESDIPAWMREFGIERLIGMFPDTPSALKKTIELGFQIIERRERPGS